MSSYATTTQLAQYAVNAQALGSISLTDQQAALDAASNEADGYLVGQYTLPLKQWDTTLVEHVCNVALYRLLGRRGYRAAGQDTGYRQRYEDAIAWFKLVNTCKLAPPGIVDSSGTGRAGAPQIITGVTGNTIGGDLQPTQVLGRANPYPWTGTLPGRRGW